MHDSSPTGQYRHAVASRQRYSDESLVDTETPLLHLHPTLPRDATDMPRRYPDLASTPF